MTYYHANNVNWFTPKLWAGQQSPYDEYWPCLLKPMTDEVTHGKTMHYRFYDESEWRIIYSQEIAHRLANSEHKDVLENFVPECEFCPELCQLLEGLDCQPKAVLPITEAGSTACWFAMIIYPSLGVKVAAEADQEIRTLINNLKPSSSESVTCPKCSSASLEAHSKPIELDLDACRNF